MGQLDRPVSEDRPSIAIEATQNRVGMLVRTFTGEKQHVQHVLTGQSVAEGNESCIQRLCNGDDQ